MSMKKETTQKLQSYKRNCCRLGVLKELHHSCSGAISHESSLAVSLAAKRINQADKEKWVIEESYDTDWINLEQPTAQQLDFLVDCKIRNFSFSNFLEFYRSIQERVLALNVQLTPERMN